MQKTQTNTRHVTHKENTMYLNHHRIIQSTFTIALCLVCSLTLASCKQAPTAQDSLDERGNAIPQAAPIQQIKTVAFEVYPPRIEYSSYGGDCGEDVPGCSPETFYDEVCGTMPNELCVRPQKPIYGIEDNPNACILKTPFITEKDFKAANLQPGDMFKTTHKNNLKTSDTQYQVISGDSENAYVHSVAPDGAETDEFKPCLLNGHYVDDCFNLPTEKIIRVKVVSGNAT